MRFLGVAVGVWVVDSAGCDHTTPPVLGPLTAARTRHRTNRHTAGWGTSFHFAHRWANEEHGESLKRHEHYLALRLGLKPGDKVLDVGCGVGGPLREIALFSGAHITGEGRAALGQEAAAAAETSSGRARRPVTHPSPNPLPPQTRPQQQHLPGQPRPLPQQPHRPARH